MSDKDIGDVVPPKVGRQVGAILFACNINAVRSAMAEAMVKYAFPGKIFVDSCGVTPGIQDGFQQRLWKNGPVYERMNQSLLMI